MEYLFFFILSMKALLVGNAFLFDHFINHFILIEINIDHRLIQYQCLLHSQIIYLSFKLVYYYLIRVDLINY